MNDDDVKDSVQSSENETAATPLLDWETPRLEDVSEQVMAQPYIRFT